MSGTLLTEAHAQWQSRPDDQRFLSLADLKASVKTRKAQSWTAAPDLRDLNMVVSGKKLSVEVYDPTVAKRVHLEPTHWAFGQLAAVAGAPAGYLRTLPAQMAAMNLQWGLDNHPTREDGLVLARSNGEHSLRAITSSSYGRIWDLEVVEAVERANWDGRWEIPAASYATANPKRATTLYASDQDVFIFLVDPKHPIEVPGEDQPKFRGFMASNSEVGAGVFKFCSFLYDRVCDNRCIWGAMDIHTVNIIHRSGAPDRFAYEGARYLKAYSEQSTALIVDRIQKAKQFEVKAEGKDGFAEWLQKRGFTKAVSKAAVESALVEQGECHTLYNLVNGVTAHARTISHTNERVDLEAKAGRLLDMVA